MEEPTFQTFDCKKESPPCPSHTCTAAIFCFLEDPASQPFERAARCMPMTFATARMASSSSSPFSRDAFSSPEIWKGGGGKLMTMTSISPYKVLVCLHLRLVTDALRMFLNYTLYDRTMTSISPSMLKCPSPLSTDFWYSFTCVCVCVCARARPCVCVRALSLALSRSTDTAHVEDWHGPGSACCTLKLELRIKKSLS